MGLFGFAILVVSITVACSIAGLLLVRKRVCPDRMKPHNQVADPMFTVIGTLYAVLLGLLVVQSMKDFQDARQEVEAESNSLAEIFKLAEALPDPLRDKIQTNSLDYARAVMTEEWDDMEREAVCEKAWVSIDKIWWDVINFTPHTQQEEYVYNHLLESASDLIDHRRSRLVTCRTWVSPMLWLVLLTGAVSVIGFTYIFGVQSLVVQVIMTSLVAVTLSLNIFLWASYSNPFYGLLKVEAEAFEMAVENFEWYLKHPDEHRWNVPKRIEFKEGVKDKLDDKLQEELRKELIPGLDGRESTRGDTAGTAGRKR